MASPDLEVGGDCAESVQADMIDVHVAGSVQEEMPQPNAEPQAAALQSRLCGAWDCVPSQQEEEEEVASNASSVDPKKDAALHLQDSREVVVAVAGADEAVHSPKARSRSCLRRACLAGALASSVLCSAAIVAWLSLGGAAGDEADTEVVVHVAGHDLDDADVHTVFERMKAGEKNLTLQVVDSVAGANSTFSLAVERFQFNVSVPSKVILLVNEEAGGFLIGNTSIKAVVCESDGIVESRCRIETALPRLLMDDNTADTVKYIATAAVVGAVLITAIAVAPQAFFAAAPAMITAAAGCFPASATVQAFDGMRAIKSLSIGTLLMTSQGYAPMFLSGHHDAIAITTMVKFTTVSNHTLAVTPDHYLPMPGGTYKSAGQIGVGDELIVQSDGGFLPSRVESKDHVQMQGLFNPFTTTGDLVVDGVLASCHSSWFLEGRLSEEYIVPIYQRIFQSLVLLYTLAPGWFDRFASEFADDDRALSDAGVVNVAKAAFVSLLR